MLKKDIIVGGFYLAKVSNKVVPVRVDRIRQQEYGKAVTIYDVTNMRTKRTTTFRSATKFRCSCDEQGNVAGIATKRKQLQNVVADYNALPTEEQTQQAEAAYNELTTAAIAEAEVAQEQAPFSPASATTPPCSPASAGATTAEPAATPLTERPSTASSLGAALANGAARRKHPPTPEQQAILDAVSKLGRGDVLVVQAGAGAGKTSTQVMIEEVLPGRGQYTAFNKSLVKESSHKFRRAACNTTHSLAFRAIGKRYAKRLDSERVRSRDVACMLGIEDFTVPMPTPDNPDNFRILAAGFLAGQVTQAVKRFCQSADQEIGESHIKYVDGLDMPEDGRRTYANNNRLRQYLLPFCQKAWADLSDPDGKLPFSHDVYVKVWQLEKPVISADYIMLDEAQDTAEVMLDILKQQKAALLIIVGDSAQSIYEWRGAVNAMAAFPEAKELTLSQSFRFGQAIADVANQILAEIPGITLRLRGFDQVPSTVGPVAKPHCILTRTNAAAIGAVLQAMADGERPHLIGGGSDVVAFVEAALALQAGKPTSHPELACFGSWSEVQEYVKQDEGEDLKLMVKLIDSFGAETILNALKRMPTEDHATLTVCTAHKSKGREWDTVKLAPDFPTLSKCSEADFKLIYVAATRAKLRLDVTECPFFTGEDALELLPSPEGFVLPEAPAVAPPTPSQAPSDKFTWAKDKDGKWRVRGPAGQEGQKVQVFQRNGSSEWKRLTHEVGKSGDACLYESTR